MAAATKPTLSSATATTTLTFTVSVFIMIKIIITNPRAPSPSASSTARSPLLQTTAQPDHHAHGPLDLHNHHQRLALVINTPNTQPNATPSPTFVQAPPSTHCTHRHSSPTHLHLSSFLNNNGGSHGF